MPRLPSLRNIGAGTTFVSTGGDRTGGTLSLNSTTGGEPGPTSSVVLPKPAPAPTIAKPKEQKSAQQVLDESFEPKVNRIIGGVTTRRLLNVDRFNPQKIAENFTNAQAF